PVELERGEAKAGEDLTLNRANPAAIAFRGRARLAVGAPFERPPDFPDRRLNLGGRHGAPALRARGKLWMLPARHPLDQGAGEVEEDPLPGQSRIQKVPPRLQISEMVLNTLMKS